MIGFFGGSFDPIHLGHLNNARQLKQQLELSQLFLMPCGAPVHKDSLKFSSKQRLEMLELAVQEFPELSIDTREIDSEADSYTIDSLKQIKKQYPQQSIALIIGMDSFNQLSSWKKYQQLSQFCHLIVLGRPGQTKSDNTYGFELTNNKTRLSQKTTGLLYFAQTDLHNISSSDIRGILFDDTAGGKIRAKQNLDGLLPASVINYLRKDI